MRTKISMTSKHPEEPPAPWKNIFDPPRRGSRIDFARGYSFHLFEAGNGEIKILVYRILKEGCNAIENKTARRGGGLKVGGREKGTKTEEKIYMHRK